MTDQPTPEHNDPLAPREASEYPGGATLFERLLEQARHSGDGRAHRSAPNPNDVETVIDRLIEQARAEGAFDNLPGAGKPLRRLTHHAIRCGPGFIWSCSVQSQA
jgi:hypothetical protein